MPSLFPLNSFVLIKCGLPEIFTCSGTKDSTRTKAKVLAALSQIMLISKELALPCPAGLSQLSGAIFKSS